MSPLFRVSIKRELTVVVIIALNQRNYLTHHIVISRLLLLCETVQVAAFATQSQESVKSDWINPNEVML